ncbi:MAG TPA: YbaB/EbfC family nucleoid-associated protein [Pseudonocardiaceae bacterium]
MSSPVPADGDATDAALDRWVADAEAMAVRYQQLSTDVERVSVSETTPDGLITVTVNSGGLVTDVRITERATGMPGPRVAAGVLWAMRQAQSRIAGQVAEVMRSTIGDDTAMVNAVLNRYENTFPAPPEPTRPPVVTEVRLGDRDAREMPTPQQQPMPARVRRPAAADDWDGGDSFLEEVDR